MGRTKTALELEEPHVTGGNVLERSAVDVVIRHGADVEGDPSHWSAADLQRIRVLRRNTVIVAAVSGAVSGAIIGLIEIISRSTIYIEGAASVWDNWRYWVLYLAIVGVVSGIEILVLYWLVLRRSARVAAVAGLGLSSQAIERVIVVGLSRAALEMPNPRTSIYGIDPYARVSRWQLLGYTLLYRLKIGATSFVLRILMRRLLARAAVRAYIPLLAIPVFAIWNALVIGWVMREVQVRVAGPRGIDDAAERLAMVLPNLDADGRELIIQAVAESAQRARDAHPNLVLLFGRLFRDLELVPADIELDWAQACPRVAALDPAARDVVLAMTSAACAVSGRIRRRQIELLRELHDACGLALDVAALHRLHRDFVDGQGLPQARLAAVSAGPVAAAPGQPDPDRHGSA